ncbi:focadhesin isoform X1 [Hydra vulgaris]|uniref:focadhesin isoform X1 n=2 Tax=Hydra vulgaris TaxID=6087 RepID=UPI001F5EACD5|nr:focadhesin isoform X1 [Hydra vulgaris]
MSIEEFEQKLKFPHCTIQKQAITQLYIKAEDYFKKNGKITSANSSDCASIVYLLKNVGNMNEYISRQCCECLLCLVVAGHLCDNLVLASCVTSSALKCPIKNICWLILNIAYLKEAWFLQSDSLHPLSQVLLNNTEFSKELFISVQSYLISTLHKDFSLTSNKQLLKVFASIEPFLKFVLYETCYGVELIEIFSQLLSFQNSNENFSLFQKVLELCKNKKMVDNSSKDFLSVSVLLAVWYINHLDLKDVILINDLIWMLVTGIWESFNGLLCYYIHQALFLLRQLLFICLQDKKKIFLQFKEELLLFCALIMAKSNEVEVLKEILLFVFSLIPECLRDLTVEQSKSLISVLVFPMLKLLSDQHSCFEKSDIHRMILDFFGNIENILICDSKVNIPLRSLNISIQYSKIFNICHSSLSMLTLLHSDNAMTSSWLTDINFMVKSRNTLPKENIILMLSTVLVMHTNEELFRKALQTILVVCQHDISMVMNFFPLLLYCLRSDRFKKVKLDVLYIIPELVLHKILVGIALKLVKSLSMNLALFPLAVKLGVEIWKKQPRVFPHILQLFYIKFDKPFESKVWYECLLAKINAAYEICDSGSAHGKDMVAVLSSSLDMLNADCNVKFSEYKDSCYSLLIETLKSLCLNKVVTVESIWKIINTKVQSKKSVSVLCSICSLLACIPIVRCKSVIQQEVISYLWILVQSSKINAVISAAYFSLAEFPLEEMKVKYLPEKVRTVVCDQLKALINQDSDENFFPLEEVIPGFGFSLLLHETEKEVMSGFSTFLSSMLSQEVANLPRGIGKKGHLILNRSISSPIVKFLSDKYEQSNRPGLLPGLAAGLLCCYVPYIHGMDRENPSKVHLEIQAGRYKQMLENLLQDFAIQQNDWHHAMLAPQSWCHFMKNLYLVCIQGRKANLEISKEKKLISDEEFQEDSKSIKFWVRDQITDQLKKASKQSPHLQGNSVLGLVGLAHAVSNYEENNDKCEGNADPYLSMRTWLLKVADTIMVVFDGNFKAKSIPFQWCQQISSGKSTASSLVARCFAALSMGELASILLPIDSERILFMLNMLLERCPYQSKAGSSSLLNFYCSLSLGMLISNLYQQQQYTEMVASNFYTNISSSVNVLENIIFNDELDKKEGACVGYGLAVVSAIMHDLNNYSKAQAIQIRNRILEKCGSLHEADMLSIFGQELYFVLAYLTMAMFTVDILTIEEVKNCTKFMQIKAESSLSVGLQLALGVLNYTMLQSKTEKNLSNDILENWHNILSKKESNVLKKLGAVKGIFASYGIHSLFLRIINDLDQFKQSINTSLKLLFSLFDKSPDDSICLLVAEQLGYICLLEEKSSSVVSLPQSYNYLKEISLLRNIFDLLMKPSMSNCINDLSEDEVLTLLKSLVALKGVPLPPVNWVSILGPLTRAGFSDFVKQLCIQFAIFYVGSSNSMALWISSFISSSLFTKLAITTQKMILLATESLLPYLTTNKQRVILEELPIYCLFLSDHKSQFVSCVFQQWLAILKMSTPPQSTISYVSSALKIVLDKLKDVQMQISNHDLKHLAKLVCLLQGEDWRKVLHKLPKEIRYRLQIEILYLLSPTYDDILEIVFGEEIVLTNIYDMIQMIFSLKDVKLLEYLVKRVINDNQEDKNIFMSIVYKACLATQNAGSFVLPIDQMATNGSYMNLFIRYITSNS